MKTLRLPFGLGGVVGLGCAAWAVCLTVGLAWEVRAQQFDPTIEVPVTFYDFHSDRSNPEFEQPHSGGKAKTTGMVEELLDADDKPVTKVSGAFLNHGMRFWFRDNSKLGTYNQKDPPTGVTVVPIPTGSNYLTKFRPIYRYSRTNNNLPGIKIASNNGDDEFNNQPTWVKNEYTPTNLGNDNYSIDTAYKNTVIPAKLVFSHTSGGIYKFESKSFFPLKQGNGTFTSVENNDNKVIFSGTSPTALTSQSWRSTNNGRDG